MRKLLILAVLATISCATPGPPTKPNDREWSLLMADYQWIQTLRSAQQVPPSNAPRKQQIEITLENLRKIEPTYHAFMEKLGEYHGRTGDPRAVTVIAREKILIGDQYMNLLSRYDSALSAYRAALQVDPTNQEAAQRVSTAEGRRYVSMNSLASIKQNMKEEDVRRLIGLPREDWIKQVMQNGRAYSVWIYPKADGGASAIYFDNGLVYHTNWNAAAPPPAQSAPQTK